MRNLKPADKNGGESSRPILMPNQVEPQIRHKTANKKEGRKLLLLAEEEFIRSCLFERYLGQTLDGLKAQVFKSSNVKKLQNRLTSPRPFPKRRGRKKPD
jgi:hypothetical protein